MNKFLEMKEHGSIIRFSDLLKEIPPDDVLLALFPAPRNPQNPLITHEQMEVLKLLSDELTQAQIAGELGVSRGRVTYLLQKVKKNLYGNIPDYIYVDIPVLKKLLHTGVSLPRYSRLSEYFPLDIANPTYAPMREYTCNHS